MMSYKITRPDLEKQDRKFVRKKVSKVGKSWLVVSSAKNNKIQISRPVYSSTPSNKIN